MYVFSVYFTCLFVFIFSYKEISAEQDRVFDQFQRPNVTNVVLIGATGDLAKKYLWNGFFKLFRQERREKNTFRFYAAARDDFNIGKMKIDTILDDCLKCPANDSSCADEKSAFVSVTQYHRLKAENDYKSLCLKLSENVSPDEREGGRLFYLSVPPFAYSQIAQRIHSFCRHGDKHTWTRLVLEKPFGSDLKSAQELAKNLSNYFNENEIYRIDHYLGKTGVMQILDFRFDNHEQYKDVWNRDHIERVEIVLKERSDCKGRTNFYDSYGVIRDVMQNHMTELIVMVAMELPNSLSNKTSIMQNKLRLLKEIKPMNRWSAVTGQYKEYNKHCHLDKGQDETVAPHSRSNTPTFASVSVFINNARWHSVPFVLVSGKQLDERTAYVRVVFKSNIHKVHSASSKAEKCDIRQIVFHIQGEHIQKPAILISGILPKPVSFQPLKAPEKKPVVLFGCSMEDFYALNQKHSVDAYTTLISAVYHEQQNLFVGTEDLLTSWKVWTHLLDSLNNTIPQQYVPENLEVLEFTTLGERLEFSWKNDKGTCDNDGICKSAGKTINHYRPELFRNNHLETGTCLKVIKNLAISITEHALRAVSMSGIFHLALPGGTSPVMLFESLAFSVKEFPWQHTHIWLVDERCVPPTSKDSNFNLVYEKLFKHIPVSPFNIHPMYVMLKSGLCDVNDNGAEHFEAELRRSVANSQLDFVVLGVGSDGHTASLFPHQTVLNKTDKWISLTETGYDHGVNQRMTMTLSLLNKAKTIAVLVVGNQKQNVVKEISSGEVDIWNYPVTGIHPDTGDMTWYIDNEALGLQ